MAEKPSAELIGLIVFIALGMVFVVWLIGQFQEFAFFFGFRLSDLLAGDLSGLVTASAGVPGDVSLTHIIKSKTSAPTQTNIVDYRFYFLNHLLCVQSVWSVQINTTDCYPLQSSDITAPSEKTADSTADMVFGVKKSPAATDDNGGYVKAKIEITEEGG